ncbi:beta and beta-prime subunits of DNA dependent RNA-polymerase [Thelephora ganbajun]|uniref:Beta and beta-prime subunits of DNA dependent RNA-polymerase n=1 Tax=Thelephora ganbajun TaxID=370292 RepID=A0ACB6ZUW0_THEGA|nr:beta and beta-prime subunits of DNA dependent RNA-polymerase [Thelephora ganbajun]
MNVSQSIPSTVQSISFSFLTTEDIRRVSVKQIINPTLLDDLNRPNLGGLYDPALGPSDRNDLCKSCHASYDSCPGHFGHIELPAPVFHPLFMVNMFNLLRATCLFCHHFKAKRVEVAKFAAKLRLLERGLLIPAQKIDDLQLYRVKDEDAAEEGQDDVVLNVRRINDYVEKAFKVHGKGQRDAYKDELVFQTKKEVITEFLKYAMLKKCANCSAFGHTFRKEGHTKIIEYELTKKQKDIHNMLEIRRPSVLSSIPTGNSSGQGPKRGDSDVEVSDAESERGGPTASDEEQEQERNEQPAKSASGKIKGARGRNERVVAPEEVRAHLRRLYANEVVMCSLLFGRHGPFAKLSKGGYSLASADMFFMEVIPVTPTRFRPPAKLGDTLFEHPQNELLTRLLNTSYRLRDLNAELNAVSMKSAEYDEDVRRSVLQDLLNTLVQLQIDVNSLIDSSKNPQPVRKGKLPPAGVKQGLEKKEGLFRKNMMGKRVNYAARSVISPDVNIEPNEIGIPPVFARKLTYPEPVIPANLEKLRQAVINGPDHYPGAKMIEYEDGRLQSLDKLSRDQRKALANTLLTVSESASGSTHGSYIPKGAVNKKVYRHLEDGDILILNRQPTLHKPSMMCHKARVLLGEKTIRMHYANCNSYNADFDGDEMNIHFPQNQIARAEAYHIANTDNQYLVPTSGKPLRGLIQDHVVAGVWMTNRDTFFTREEYFQLLYGALKPEDGLSHHSGLLVTLPPAIVKPRALWTGKQIISTIMKNITPSIAEGLNLNAKAKVPGMLWGKESGEDKVIFMDGELLCGILDKSAFGASDYGLVHSVYEVYSAEIAGKLLGILSRLFTKFLQHRAFTCRMDDLALTPKGNARRRELLIRGAGLGTDAAIENFPSLAGVQEKKRGPALKTLLEGVLRDDGKMAGLDMTVKKKMASLTKSIADAVMPYGLLRHFPHNHMQVMTQSGAKGSTVNAQQISCALGQQELEGRRVPVMVSGKTLPSFKPFETKAIAGGYIASRFLTGIKPQEFFFHCMAGREGLIDTAVKTSRSGYLQRCLIKHLEGICVHYDHTVRGSDSSVLQFHYGGDSLDVTKQKHLTQFEFMAQNQVSFVNRYQPRNALGLVDDRQALEYMKKVIKKSVKRVGVSRRSKRDALDPALTKFSPSGYLGATSEKFAENVNKYIKANPDGLFKVKDEGDTLPKVKRKAKHGLVKKAQFQALMNVKYMRSLIEPGEAVGLLASQGIGEPSTQMTLNTFHFAGHGAANVTLGIPRLREIIMTASTKPKTPSMRITVRPGRGVEEIKKFCKTASRLTLSQVVDSVVVTEKLVTEQGQRNKVFTIKINFFPEEEYRTEYDITPAEIKKSFGIKFAQVMKKEIQIELKKLDADLKSQISALGKGEAEKESRSGRGVAAEDADDDEPAAPADDGASEVGDGDADTAKRARQQAEQVSYESDEESEEALDDEAIEAIYTEPGKETEGDEEKSKAKGSSSVEHQFHLNLPVASSFKFTTKQCTIQLTFGADIPKLLLVGLVERTCAKTVVREIPGIVNCFQLLGDNDSEKIVLSTNGSNIAGLWELSSSGDPLISVDDIYTNHIDEILRTYGVEAARTAIVKEMSVVFGVYNIDVNIRHLELIADYMTFEGGYRPFNRRGISTNPSPLLKASYETTAAFLSDAALHGDFDDLTTPSGNIVLGRLSRVGTGVFDVVTKVEY